MIDVPDHISLWGLILPIRKLVQIEFHIPHPNNEKQKN